MSSKVNPFILSYFAADIEDSIIVRTYGDSLFALFFKAIL